MVTVYDSKGNKLDERILPNTSNGLYLYWKLTGESVRFRITALNGQLASWSGAFLD